MSKSKDPEYMDSFHLSMKLSVMARDLGFDDRCTAFYDSYPNNVLRPFAQDEDDWNVEDPIKNQKVYCSAPTYDQIREWLSRVQRVRAHTKALSSGFFSYSIHTWLGGAKGWEQHTGIVEKHFHTEREAKEYMIEKSFEIIKNKQNLTYEGEK